MSEGANGDRVGTSPCPHAGEVETPDALELVSFYKGAAPTVRIVPGGRWRDWMNDTAQRAANRCLPLLMANQAGWVILNPASFTARWDGGDRPSSMTVEYPADTPEQARIASSHFGYGIVTFMFHDVLRTSPGYNLLARGPTNYPKDGVCALDGVIETDWSDAPFTMNWKLTRPGEVSFAADEAFCQLMPLRRGELERFRPEYRSASSEPGLERRITAWSACRRMVQLGKQSAEQAGDETWRRLWLEDYFRGRHPTGEPAPEHQTTIRLAEFADGVPPTESPINGVADGSQSDSR